jgi:hypothetical protein
VEARDVVATGDALLAPVTRRLLERFAGTLPDRSGGPPPALQAAGAFRLPEDLDTTYDYLIGMLTTGVGQIDASR